ncbi:SDR family oxidoreductase [Mycobacterium sp. URHB0044]|jgi:long-subunit acyl-CoA synthetase (AMP-forming)|uniref:SDR family oxidoreductase n=1 Tax=Mycobacterium sp. URHB0044 TaxID=1380386 RepID=UPI000491A67E|nr:SDR family oxidoreductase [Mycobacterium sp. URHB0044]
MSAAERITELAATFGARHANVAWLLCDRHPADGLAFTVIDPDGAASTVTFGQLGADSHRYARALQGLGVGPRDRVATLMGKSAELVTVILAIWRLGAVGIIGLTRTLALEGARHGITANAIAPGLIETPMLASMNGPARDKLTNKIPLRHTGRPEDIGEAVAFLASEDAGYITGVVLDVDGGISIGSSIR